MAENTACRKCTSINLTSWLNIATLQHAHSTYICLPHLTVYRIHQHKSYFTVSHWASPETCLRCALKNAGCLVLCTELGCWLFTPTMVELTVSHLFPMFIAQRKDFKILSMISTECILLSTIVKLMSVILSQAMLSPGPSVQGMTLKSSHCGPGIWGS